MSMRRGFCTLVLHFIIVIRVAIFMWSLEDGHRLIMLLYRNSNRSRYNSVWPENLMDWFKLSNNIMADSAAGTVHVQCHDFVLIRR